jgi:hypothetical protein
VPELSSVLYSTREALLHEGRKHFTALNIKALGVERLEAAQMRIERSLNALVQGRIPLHIEVKGLGHFEAAQDEELLLTALQVSFNYFLYNIY